jgi:hypothetical protein
MVKSLILKVLLISLLTSCTTPIVRDTSSIDALTEKCDDADCVIKLMDTLPQGDDSSRYPFMETLPDTNLEQLKTNEKLSI